MQLTGRCGFLTFVLLTEVVIQAVCGQLTCDSDYWFFTTDCDLGDYEKGDIMPVSDVSVTTRQLSPAGTTSRSNLTISWSKPESNLRQMLKGFIVRIHRPDNKPTICHIFNITTLRDQVEKFTFECLNNELVFPAGAYDIDVSPIPQPGSLHPVIRSSFYIVQKIGDTDHRYSDAAAYWGTDLVVHVDKCTQIVLVTFALAPQQYRFEQYTIKLMDNSSGHMVYSDTFDVSSNAPAAPIGSATFKDVEHGAYFAGVSAVNTDWPDKELCRCQCRVLGPNCHYIPGCPSNMAFNCIESRSKGFLVPNASCSFQSTVSSIVTDPTVQPPAAVPVAGIVIGCVLGIIFLTMFIFFILWKTSGRRNVPPQKEGTTEKKILLLYIEVENDMLFQECVQNLASFLRAQCGFQVICPRSASLKELDTLLRESHTVLFIVSNLVYSIMADQYLYKHSLENNIFFRVYNLAKELDFQKKVVAASFVNQASRPAPILFPNHNDFVLPQEIDRLCYELLCAQGEGRLSGNGHCNSLSPVESDDFISGISDLQKRLSKDSGVIITDINKEFDDGLSIASSFTCTIAPEYV